MAEILPFPSGGRPKPVDDGSVMSAAELLAYHSGRLAEYRKHDPLEDLVQSVWGRPRGDGPEAA